MLASTIQFSNTNQTLTQRPTSPHNTHDGMNQGKPRTREPHPHGCCLRTQQCAKHTTLRQSASTRSTPTRGSTSADTNHHTVTPPVVPQFLEQPAQQTIAADT